MRKIIQEFNVYKIDELSEEAKEKAYDKWRNNLEYPWDSEAYDTLKEFTSLFDVNVYDYDCSQYNHYFRFHTNKEQEVDDLSGLRLLKYIVNNYWSNLFTRKLYYKQWKKQRKSKIFVEHSCVLTGVCFDEYILEPIYKFLEKPYDVTYYGLMEECLSSYFTSIQEDMKYCQSEESFKEEAKANEWEYLENGEQFYNQLIA